MTREECKLSIVYLEGIKDNYIEGNGYERHPLPEYYAIETAIKALEQEPILEKVRAEIAEYGSIWVAYVITGHSDRDIENLIEGVLKRAKEQVLEIIDKYRQEGKI